jgi:ubiquinone/menaquinone biosynthesis C-methylase UbiE
MSESLVEGLFRGAYVSFRLFYSDNAHDLVAIVFAPDLMPAAQRGLAIRCVTTGRVAGSTAPYDTPSARAVAQYMPPGYCLVHARLREFCDFTTDADRVMRPPVDLAFEVIDRFGVPIAPGLEAHWYAACTLPVPSAENIVRVAGGIGNNAFLMGGATSHARVQRLIETYVGRDAATLGAVLDWGVGCGRIARHFLERGQTNIHGVDIDAMNIAWLNQTMGWNQATRVDFDPPMPYADASIDVAYSYSVFTHLAYDDQLKWLAELRRVLKPGGYAFMTVCGESGVYVSKFRELKANPGFVREYLDRGFYDFAAQNVGVDAGREGYYRLIAHTRRFIRDVWSGYLDVHRILPCFMEQQDMIVLQRPVDAPA